MDSSTVDGATPGGGGTPTSAHQAGSPTEEVEEAAAAAAISNGSKIPFAFTICSSVQRNGCSAFVAECNICGKKVREASPRARRMRPRCILLDHVEAFLLST